MSLLIPALEWGDVVFTGNTTITDPNVLSIVDTSRLFPGMRLSGAGIPAGTTILSKTVNSIVMSQNATATATGVSITAFYRFEFDYPPREDSEDDIRAQVRRVKSLSGLEQTQTEFVEAIRTLSFDFITGAQRDTLLNEFVLKWALIGKPFRYFDDKALVGFKTYTNDRFDFDQVRTVKKHPSFLYRIPFRFRRSVSFGQ